MKHFEMDEGALAIFTFSALGEGVADTDGYQKREFWIHPVG
jgi:hypothetical protein